MPILYSIVGEVDSHILRPISKILSNKIINTLNLQNVIKENLFIDTGFTTTQMTNERNHKSIAKQNQFKVSTEINLNPYEQIWGDTSNYVTNSGYGYYKTNLDQDFGKLFSDREAGIYISELVVPTTLTLNCTLLLTDRSLAYETFSLMHRTYVPGMVLSEHISYDFPIPKNLYYILFNLYKLRRLDKDNSYSSKINFKQYLKQYSVTWLDFLVNRNKTKKELIGNKHHINSLYTVEFDEQKPNEIKNNKLVNQYEISFTYKIQFGRPDTLILSYPHVVDNVLIPEELIHTTESLLDPIKSLEGKANIPLCNQDKSMRLPIPQNPVRFPYYDDWIYPTTTIASQYYTPFIILTSLNDETQDYTIEDLNFNLSGIEINPLVREIIKEQGNESFKVGCLFHIAVFANNLPMSENVVSLDGLNLKYKATNIHKTRRIVISIISGLKYLDEKWYKYLDNLNVQTELIVNYKGETHVDGPFRRQISTIISTSQS